MHDRCLEFDMNVLNLRWECTSADHHIAEHLHVIRWRHKGRQPRCRIHLTAPTEAGSDTSGSLASVPLVLCITVGSRYVSRDVMWCTWDERSRRFNGGRACLHCSQSLGRWAKWANRTMLIGNEHIETGLIWNSACQMPFSSLAACRRM